jgi:undecaprenyl-phosphate 4-deoxy-4-formamido-L-arabinose transferase
MKISFVIPCYRSEKTIEGVVAEIKSVVSRRPEVDYEIVMVSDHSPDKVYSVIERLCHDDPAHLRGMELARNFGQHAALMAGYAHSRGDLVFSLDDDGQAPCDSIWELVDKLETAEYDVVYGVYSEIKQCGFRRFGTGMNHFMMHWLLDKPKNVYLSSFVVMRRFVVEEMLRYSGPYPFLCGLIFRITKNVGNVPVEQRVRADGVSGYTFRSLLALWMNGFTAFSVKPLRLTSYVGVLLAVIGVVASLWTVVDKLFFHPDMPIGYGSLMAVLLFIGGSLMLVLGLIGEYIGRIYICLNNAPQYVLSKRTQAICPTPTLAQPPEE